MCIFQNELGNPTLLLNNREYYVMSEQTEELIVIGK